MFKKNELKLLWPYYIYLFFENFLGIAPLVWIVYFNLKGFSFTEISISLAVFTAAIFIFEIPTGALADIFGRKKTVFYGFFIFGLLPLAVPFIKTFFGLVVLYVLWGFGATLVSGAEDALVIDFLKHKKRPDLIDEFYVTSSSIISMGWVLAGLLLSGLLLIFPTEKVYTIFGHAFLGIDVVWLVQGLGIFFVSFLILFFISEDHFKRKKEKNIVKYFIKSFRVSKEGFKYAVKHPVLIYLMTASAIAAAASEIWLTSYQPFLLSNGLEIKTFGFLYTIVAGVGIFIPPLAKRLAGKFREKKNYFALIFFANLLWFLAVAFFFGPVMAFIFYLVALNLRYFIFPVYTPYFQKHVPSEMRATVTSVSPMFSTAGTTISLLITGILIDAFGPRTTIFISAFVYIPAIVLFLRIKDDNKQPSDKAQHN